MRRTSTITILFFSAVLFANGLWAHVTLNYPVGGETFTAGDTVTIIWEETVQHNTQNWDLYYSEDGGNSWDPVALDLDVALRQFDWIVPVLTTVEAKIQVIQDNDGTDYQSASGNFTIQETATAIGEPRLKAKTFEIHGNYPNPFNPETTIKYNLPIGKTLYNVKVEIYNALGQVVNVLKNGTQNPGGHAIKWNGKNTAGSEMPSGLYFAVVQADQYKAVQKMIMVK